MGRLEVEDILSIGMGILPVRRSSLSEYREEGVGKTVWEHTMGMFAKAEKINEGRTDAATS
jgi:hypothetical protein